jgi:hypothetical protein
MGVDIGPAAQISVVALCTKNPSCRSNYGIDYLVFIGEPGGALKEWLQLTFSNVK